VKEVGREIKSMFIFIFDKNEALFYVRFGAKYVKKLLSR